MCDLTTLLQLANALPAIAEVCMKLEQFYKESGLANEDMMLKLAEYHASGQISTQQYISILQVLSANQSQRKVVEIFPLIKAQ